MSSELSFEFRDQSVRVFITEDKKELFHGADVCRALGRSDNFARTIKTFVKEKWWIEYPGIKGGKPVLCLFEPGLYQLATNPIFDSEFASAFQDKVFEEVLPKLRASGFYIDHAAVAASEEKMAALQAEVNQVRSRLRQVEQIQTIMAETTQRISMETALARINPTIVVTKPKAKLVQVKPSDVKDHWFDIKEDMKDEWREAGLDMPPFVALPGGWQKAEAPFYLWCEIFRRWQETIEDEFRKVKYTGGLTPPIVLPQ